MGILLITVLANHSAPRNWCCELFCSPLFSNSFSLITMDNDNNTIPICLPTMLYSRKALNFLLSYELLTSAQASFCCLVNPGGP